VTPHKYLTGIVTEEGAVKLHAPMVLSATFMLIKATVAGICYPPFTISLKAAKEKAMARAQEQWSQRLAAYSNL